MPWKIISSVVGYALLAAAVLWAVDWAFFAPRRALDDADRQVKETQARLRVVEAEREAALSLAANAEDNARRVVQLQETIHELQANAADADELIRRLRGRVCSVPKPRASDDGMRATTNRPGSDAGADADTDAQWATALRADILACETNIARHSALIAKVKVLKCVAVPPDS